MELDVVTTAEWVGLTAAVASSAVLLYAGSERLIHRITYVSVLRMQSVVPGALAGPATSIQALVELSLGITMLALILVGGSPTTVVAVSACSATLFLGYSLFAIYLVRRRPGVPCGCSTTTNPASVWTVVRALALVLLSLASNQAALPPPFGVRFLMAATQGIGIAMILWLLPEALARPWSASGSMNRGAV